MRLASDSDLTPTSGKIIEMVHLTVSAQPKSVNTIWPGPDLMQSHDHQCWPEFEREGSDDDPARALFMQPGKEVHPHARSGHVADTHENAAERHDQFDRFHRAVGEQDLAPRYLPALD